MQLAMIGLGKMGGNMTERLMRDGHGVVAFDRDAAVVSKYQALGAKPAKDLADIVKQLDAPRVVWIMVPSGKPTDDTIDALSALLEKGDIIIDGGNSNFKDTIARSKRLAGKGIRFIDSGTSGGIWGLANGYCLMVGGADDAVKHCEPIFLSLAQEGRLRARGPVRRGALCEDGAQRHRVRAAAGLRRGLRDSRGVEDLPGLDLHQIAELWQHGSVVRSWLNELAVNAFAKDAKLSQLKGYVADSGEGRWTVAEAIDLDVPAPVITLSLLMRFRSRQEDSFGAKVIAALRNEFGGHAVKKGS